MAKTSSANTFKIGDLAVYPAHGVAIIENLEDRSISGQKHSFYILRVLDSNATIMVPVANASAVGLRKVMKKAMVPKVYSILKEKRDLLSDSQTWNRRYRDYTEKLKTGCAMEVAKVLRDLYTLKIDKELSFGERRMLDTAKNLLVKEISIAKKKKEVKIEEELDHIIRS